MVKIKICGVRTREEALAAEAAGADAIGFVFASSPRRISPEAANKISRVLSPFISRVGVFVNEKKETVQAIANKCGLTALQFHGNEDADYCTHFSLPVIKAVRVSSRKDLEVMQTFPANAFVLDAYHPLLAGGTGLTFDWDLLRDMPPARVILAGGLNPENVGEAVLRFSPYGVDVSSGVENKSGKDVDLMNKFVEAIRRCA